MPDFFSPAFWKAQLELIMSAPWVIIPLLFVAAFVAWKIRAAIDDGEIRGLKARNDASTERLKLADDKYQHEVAQLSLAREALQILTQRVKANEPQPVLVAAAATATATFNNLATTNMALGTTLSSVNASHGTNRVYNIIPPTK
jgi:hypothetical protein